MKLDKDIKRQIVKIIMEVVDCNEPFDVYTIIGTLIEEGKWDARLDPTSAFVQVKDVVENIIPIIEYKANKTDEGFVYTPYPV